MTTCPSGQVTAVKRRERGESRVILLGLILLILGLVLNVGILYTIGIVLIVVGAVLWILGAMGRSVGGRRHYW